MCSGKNIEDIVNLIAKDVDNEKIDVYVEFPYSGSGFAGALEAYFNKQTDDKKKQKRRLTVTKTSSLNKIFLNDPNDLKGDLRDGDRLLLTDDVLGKRTIPYIAKKLRDNEFMSKRNPPVKDLVVKKYYTLIDLQRRDQNKFCRENFCVDLEGKTKTNIERIADIFYAKGNTLFKGNPYKNEDIEKIKPIIEDYLVLECNCRKENARNPAVYEINP
jgi:hypothetical protein